MKISSQKKSAEKKPTPVFEVRETTLCAQLQMSKNELRRRRQYFLVQGQHWDLVDNRVMLSRIGADILRGTKDAVVPAETAADASGAEVGAKKVPIALLCERNPKPVKFEGKLVVWSMPGHNKRVVVCHLPGTDPYNPLNLVALRVKDNAHFMRGMVIPDKKPPGNKVEVRPVGDREDTYELLGPIPRWKGRW